MKLEINKAAEVDVYRDIARIPQKYRVDKNGRTIPEGSVAKLIAGSGKAFVLIRGKDSDEASIWLDERTRNLLNVDIGSKVDVEIKKVHWPFQLWYGLKASDPSYRIASQLALLSVFLGVLGLLLGVVGLIIAFIT